MLCGSAGNAVKKTGGMPVHATGTGPGWVVGHPDRGEGIPGAVPRRRSAASTPRRAAASPPVPFPRFIIKTPIVQGVAKFTENEISIL